MDEVHIEMGSRLARDGPEIGSSMSMSLEAAADDPLKSQVAALPPSTAPPPCCCQAQVDALTAHSATTSRSATTSHSATSTTDDSGAYDGGAHELSATILRHAATGR